MPQDQDTQVELPAIDPAVLAMFGAPDYVDNPVNNNPPPATPKTEVLPATTTAPPVTETPEGKGAPAAGTPPVTTKQEPVQLTPLLQERLKQAGVELPDGVKDEELVDALRSVLAPQLHPDAARLQEALSNGTKFEDYVRDYNALEQQMALPHDQLVKHHMKLALGKSDVNPHGLEDAEIDASVAKMDASGTLVLEAARMRGELQKQINTRNAERQQYGQQVKQVDYSDPALVAQFEQQVDAYVGEAAKGKQLFGQDISKPEDQQRIAAILKTDLRVDPKERISPFHKEMRTGNNIATMALLWKAHKSGQLEALMTKKAEDGKAGLWAALNLDPPKHSASPSSTAPATDASGFVPAGHRMG